MDFEKMARVCVAKNFTNGRLDEAPAIARDVEVAIRAAFAAGREAMREEAQQACFAVASTHNAQEGFYEFGAKHGAEGCALAIGALPTEP